jgi:hypothetical protein
LKWTISFTATPLATSSSRAATMSSTTMCSPRTEPGGVFSCMPIPKAIEQAEPFGWH